MQPGLLRSPRFCCRPATPSLWSDSGPGPGRPHGRRIMFKGSIVALITAFKNGGVDEKAFQELVAWQIAEGTNGLVPCGTTGESPTLSHAEHKRVVELCVEVAK